MRKTAADLTVLSDDELLRLRFSDLGVRIEGTWLERCIRCLYDELDGAGISFRPECYLADEWLTPDNEPVVGIPFYLSHPRLAALERRMMHEVEGGDEDSCMKLLRHETGHAINYAYRLYTRKQWRHLFGRFSEEYLDRYKYRPYSKSFVLHLDDWYAQYHPDEDFAETFAVWLAPSSDWRSRYRGWKALEKLEYVDSLMKSIAKKPPFKRTGDRLWSVARLKTRLKTHYKRKTDFYAEHAPDFHDLHLGKVFGRGGDAGQGEGAGRIISRHRREILDSVTYWTGEKKYVVDLLLRSLSGRCRTLALRAGQNETYAVLRITAYVTTLIMNYIHTGRFKRKK